MAYCFELKHARNELCWISSQLHRTIAPCSYPLRHLYELLEKVSSGKVFRDLSQGFFQQTLIGPKETILLLFFPDMVSSHIIGPH